MSRAHTLIKGTLILTMTGLATRMMGFFYRIFLSHAFGEEGVGLYQLIFPVYALDFSYLCRNRADTGPPGSKRHGSRAKKEARQLLYTAS